MKTVKLSDSLYCLAALDKDLRTFDIIMETEFGTTYNSYLLIGSEGRALIESAKATFTDEYIASLEKICDISKIDYLIMNHTEPDHSGAVERLLDINPDMKIVGTMGAIGFVKAIVNRPFESISVKDNYTISLGDKTLKFMPLPNLHWPDTMFTYLVEDKALFTCDAFGAHYAHEGVLRSTLDDAAGYNKAAEYYFDNIIRPFAHPFMTRALTRISELEIERIYTGHGPVLDVGSDEILSLYKKWCEPKAKAEEKTVVIPFVSAYGYTAKLAHKIADGVKAGGDGKIVVKLFDMVLSDSAQVADEMLYADGILFGSPTFLGDALRPIWDLTAKMLPPTHSGKLASAFGSYGWSGEGVPNLIERLKQIRLRVVDGYRVRFNPDENELAGAYDFGVKFAKELV